MGREGKGRRNISSRLAVIGITLVAVLLACSFAAKTAKLKKQDDTYIAREQALDKSIAEEEKRTETLKEKQRYVNTPEYFRELAKKLLGLVDRDEIRLEETTE